MSILKIGISGKRHITAAEKDSVAKQVETQIRAWPSTNQEKKFIGYTGLASGANPLNAKNRVFPPAVPAVDAPGL